MPERSLSFGKEVLNRGNRREVIIKEKSVADNPSRALSEGWAVGKECRRWMGIVQAWVTP